MFIKPTEKATGSIFDVHEQSYDFLIYPANEDVPCPWDADIVVSSGEVTISGGLGAGYAREAKCVCTCTVTNFSQYYKLEVPDELAGDPSVFEAIQSAGWIEDK